MQTFGPTGPTRTHIPVRPSSNRNSSDQNPHTYDSVCLVQLGDRHTELLGFFLSYFASAEIDLVHRFRSDYSYVDYFERSLSKSFHRVLPEFDRRKRYGLVVLLTSNEAPLFRVTLRKRIKRLLSDLGFGGPALRLWLATKGAINKLSGSRVRNGEAPIAKAINPARPSTLFKNSAQTIAICHLAQNVTTECRNLAFSPLLQPLPWLLPVLTGLPTVAADERKPTICCMGLLEERYYQIIPELARAMPDTEFRLFVRQTHPDCMAKLQDSSNVVVVVGEGTDSMMAHLASSRFLLILDYADSRYRKDRLSGAIPFGLNLGVPMVMSSQLAALYDIRAGVVSYDDAPGTALVNRLSTITPEEYRGLVSDALGERERMARVAAERFAEFLSA
jgi:hypothetical protein